MMGILAYETFIGWNVLRPGARAMGSVTLLLRILNRPRSLSPGHGLAPYPSPTAPLTVKKPYTSVYIYIHISYTYIIRCPGETSRGNKVKNRVSRRRAAAVSYVIRGLSSPALYALLHTAYTRTYVARALLPQKALNTHFCLRELPEAKRGKKKNLFDRIEMNYEHNAEPVVYKWARKLLK